MKLSESFSALSLLGKALATGGIILVALVPLAGILGGLLFLVFLIAAHFSR